MKKLLLSLTLLIGFTTVNAQNIFKKDLNERKKEKLETIEKEKTEQERLEKIEKEKAEKKEPSFTWHTDVNKAIDISTQTGKPLFFFFTGSDWCGWCTQLKNAVFSKPEFTAWASENVVLVELDFPKKTKLDPKIQQQNNTLKNEMGVGGFPTIWFVNAEVKAEKVTLKKLGKLGTSRNVTVKVWLENANKILKTK